MPMTEGTWLLLYVNTSIRLLSVAYPGLGGRRLNKAAQTLLSPATSSNTYRGILRHFRPGGSHYSSTMSQVYPRVSKCPERRVQTLCKVNSAKRLFNHGCHVYLGPPYLKCLHFGTTRVNYVDGV